MNDIPRRSDRDLYEACCRTGSEEQAVAYTELFQGFYRVALRMVANTHHPEPEALAADCAQEALLKTHRHLADVKSPDAFRAWAAATLRNHVLNRLQQWRGQEAHLVRPYDADDDDAQEGGPALQPAPRPAPQAADPFAGVENAELALALGAAIAAAALSERSRWVVAGRYLLDLEDQVLAAQLTQREGCDVLPSHVQTTRSKNLAKLRKNVQACRILAPWIDQSHT